MKFLEDKDFKIADLLEMKSANFFICRFPEENNIYFGCSEFLVEDTKIEGFVISDFEGNTYTIPSELIIAEIKNLPDIVNENKSELVNTSTSYQEHIQNVEKTIKSLNEIPISGKVVISSVIKTKRTKSLSYVLQTLSDKYPNAYIFAFRTERTGLWIGASPETLWEWNGNEGKIMSLAGTRPVNTKNEWDKKNIEEQQLVTDFILNDLKSLSYPYQIQGPFTKNAGDIDHLCTEIYIKNIDINDGLNLARRLSPTPALSGYPRDYALKLIRNIESHPRECYGGFSGISTKERVRFYVTLRCAKLYKKEALIYAGGGITRLSDAESEWRETRLKAATLLSDL